MTKPSQTSHVASAIAVETKPSSQPPPRRRPTASPQDSDPEQCSGDRPSRVQPAKRPEPGPCPTQAAYLSWKSAPPGSVAMKELEEFLLGRAMEHDSPTLLFNVAREYLISAKTIRPGVVTLMEMVASARTRATAVTSGRSRTC